MPGEILASIAVKLRVWRRYGNLSCEFCVKPALLVTTYQMKNCAGQNAVYRVVNTTLHTQ